VPGKKLQGDAERNATDTCHLAPDTLFLTSFVFINIPGCTFIFAPQQARVGRFANRPYDSPAPKSTCYSALPSSKLLSFCHKCPKNCPRLRLIFAFFDLHFVNRRNVFIHLVALLEIFFFSCHFPVWVLFILSSLVALPLCRSPDERDVLHFIPFSCYARPDRTAFREPSGLCAATRKQVQVKPSNLRSIVFKNGYPVVKNRKVGLIPVQFLEPKRKF